MTAGKRTGERRRIAGALIAAPTAARRTGARTNAGLNARSGLPWRRASRSCAESLAQRLLRRPEPALAIHQIISPQLMERLAEAGERAIRDRGIISLAPALERFGIVESEALAVLP